METSLFKTAFLFLLIYAVVPTALVRLSGIGAISRIPRGKKRIALTFDDGPDPRYTPQILNILGQYRVKACFFVIGSKARAHPEIIRQIVQAGHEIGNHGFSHKAAWLLGPFATTREIAETNRAIEELTGQKARFCRPAWGLFNLFSLCYFRLKGLKVVLWTYMSWDWIRRATPESICRKVLGRLRDGAILVLHDGDSAPGAAKGSPAHVVEALPAILEGLRQKGLKVVPLEELNGLKSRRAALAKGVRMLWSLLEKAIRLCSGIRDLGDGKSSIWRIALRRYRGKEWHLPDGSVLRPGEQFLELHINNERLLSLVDRSTSLERATLIALKEIRNGLADMARILMNDRRFCNIEVLLGITLLHRGAELIGFTVFDMKPGLFRTVTGWYEQWLLALFHPGGFKSLKAYREKLTPKYVVISRRELVRRYGFSAIPACRTAEDGEKSVTG